MEKGVNNLLCGPLDERVLSILNDCLRNRMILKSSQKEMERMVSQCISFVRRDSRCWRPVLVLWRLQAVFAAAKAQ